MIPADVAFRQAANAAAAAFANSPPYIAYRTSVVIDAASMGRHRVINRAVEVRTADDWAALQDLPRGQHQYAHSFPLSPTFDAISYFHFDYNIAGRDALSSVTQDRVITFTDPTQSTHADAVVLGLRYYHAEYAPDSTDAIAHIAMNPLPTLTTGNKSTYFLHDVYVDTASNLPTRVVYEGPDARLACDYTVVEGHWLVRHVTLTQTVRAWLHIGQVTFNAEATNTDFSFPATPNDPELAKPPATPAPK